MLHKYLQLTQPKPYATREPVVCADGFTLSVQASKNHYCEPRVDNHNWYRQVEIGFPGEPIPDLLKTEYGILEFGACTDTYGEVWAYVPTWMVEALLELHGGIANMPKQ